MIVNSISLRLVCSLTWVRERTLHAKLSPLEYGRGLAPVSPPQYVASQCRRTPEQHAILGGVVGSLEGVADAIRTDALTQP